MTIQALPDAFSVCKVADYTLVDRKAVFCFSGQTDAERSLVCRTQDVPDNVTAQEDGWRAMRITGTLDIKLARPRARSWIFRSSAFWRAFPPCWPKTGSASSCSQRMTPITF